MREIFDQFNWWSALDILLITIVIYYVLLLVKGTRAAQMLTGMLVIVGVFLVSSVVPLTTVNWVMNKFYSSIILILVILFQDDVRHALRKIGKRSFMAGKVNIYSHQILEEMARAALTLAQSKTGALLVMERNIILSRYVDIGTLVDARISKEMILSIFNTQSPLHDGAAIIQRGRISSAGCFLPLTGEDNLTKDYGTRHRAAIGISQETDAIVVLVSEEKGKAYLVFDGQVIPAKDKDELRKYLQKYLIDKPSYMSFEKGKRFNIIDRVSGSQRKRS